MIALAVQAWGAGIELPQEDVNHPVSIRAGEAAHWKQGSYDVYVLRGDVEIRQGETVARAPEGVLWLDRAEPYTGRSSKVIAYLEGPRNSVRVDFGRGGDPHALTGSKSQTLVDRTWLGWFYTQSGIELSVPVPAEDPNVKPAIFERGLEARDPARFGVQPAQLIRQEELAAPVGQAVAPQGRRVRFVPRSGGRWNLNSAADPNTNERITTGTSGVQILIDGLDQLGSVSIETDRFVVWSANTGLTNPAGQQMDLNDGPLELYLEGNIVFRQGDRVIYADRLFYNVRQESGIVLEAEMLTPVPQFQGLLRIKADVLQQVNRQQFQAYNAALTSSRLGVPRYWLQSQNVNVIDMQSQAIDPVTGLPAVNPANGQPAVEHRMLATARDNYIYLFETPVFYWPTISTDLTSPTYYFENIRVKSDQVFGQQLLIDWDLYQLLGIQNAPENSKWSLSTDYLSQRGFALGTNYRYDNENLFGVPGAYRGFFDAWGLKDDGTDNLGRDRRVIEPETTWRGRALANHRQFLPNDFQLTAEFGVISDRNFLEQYYELEWDTLKDQDTGFELKQYLDNASWSIAADVRLNAFFTQTQGARLDHFTMGQSLLFDRLTWYEHSSVGYADMQVASTPTNPVDLAKFQLLPWEVQGGGLKAFSRQEIDLPVELGALKVVPYLLGEAAYWGSDINQQELSRVYGQGGVRASLPMWTADPNVQSELFNLNGLAHKVTFEAEYFFAQASQNLDQLPLYDAIDDDSTEAFRRRMLFNTFGLTFGDQIPKQFDARYFALRQALQSNVASPSAEIADDLTEVRLGIKQRWQTKRGLPGQERIVDWIVLDVDAVLFPQADRDNFGENLGLVDYDFQWHVGDRLTFLSDGFFDIFDQGLRQVTVGALLSRPEAGNLYIGLRSTEGPISSNVLAASTSYRMSEKWIATAGTSIDFSQAGNLGQNLAFTRVGESFLIKVGMSFDASRDNFSVNFGLEPRFLPSSRLGRVGGVQIPPAGALGLE
ncbi:hypothetical protein ETAA8_71130 [Anatilimnocola aggregata]|uniref:Organic solvent tolerance protein OstA n=1 Tax=Anatilimnocola aggregata TaxID=2528021 RepID=A0A517YNZ4_9BACT|nr:hypothetical protein ETAA8_71130 [Anatilimnocola aggregata]